MKERRYEKESLTHNNLFACGAFAGIHAWHHSDGTHFACDKATVSGKNCVCSGTYKQFSREHSVYAH
jgi:hypothetical protein